MKKLPAGIHVSDRKGTDPIAGQYEIHTTFILYNRLEEKDRTLGAAKRLRVQKVQRVQRVQRVDKPYGLEGCGGALRAQL